MNKRIKIFAGALAAVLALSASVAYALSAEPESATASGREQQVSDTVSVCDESVPLTGTLRALTDRVDPADRGFSVAELAAESVQSSGNAMIDRDAALSVASKHLEAMTSSAPSSVNAILASFTDNESAVINESGRVLLNAPAWVITFSDVTLASQGHGGDILADSTMVIDAYSGELIEVISYGV